MSTDAQMPETISIAVPGGETTATIYRASPPPGRAALTLAHGAGAGQNSAFMVEFASALAARGLDVVTFDFLYTARGRRLPDRGPVLEACYRAVLTAVGAAVESAARALFIGGKSMGGRIATQIAAADPALPIAGLVLLGYPLHPPGRLDSRRDAHLPAVRRPMLFVQGSRDAFGTPEELAPVLDRLSPRAVLHVVSGGDHSFKLAGRGMAAAQAEAHAAVQTAIADWVRRTTAVSSSMSPRDSVSPRTFRSARAKPT